MISFTIGPNSRYDRYGLDHHRRTLINQLSCAACLMLFIMNMTLTNLIAYVHLTGPQSKIFCAIIIFGSNFYLTLGLLYLDTIIIMRYLYIFKWKTIGAINDDVFALFATVNNILISVLFNFVVYKLGFADNVNYHFCINVRPNSSLSVVEKRDTKLYLRSQMFYFDVYCLVPTLSYLLHLIIFFKIFHFRRQQQVSRPTKSS